MLHRHCLGHPGAVDSFIPPNLFYSRFHFLSIDKKKKRKVQELKPCAFPKVKQELKPHQGVQLVAPRLAPGQNPSIPHPLIDSAGCFPPSQVKPFLPGSTGTCWPRTDPGCPVLPEHPSTAGYPLITPHDMLCQYSSPLTPLRAYIPTVLTHSSAH